MLNGDILHPLSETAIFGKRWYVDESVSHPANQKREKVSCIDWLATEPGFDGGDGERSGLRRFGFLEIARVSSEPRRGERNGGIGSCINERFSHSGCGVV